jgi:hypothetical protein
VKTYTTGRGQSHAEQMLEVLAGVAPSAPEEFGALAGAVLARRTTLSSVIAVLLAWDETRRDFIARARAGGLEVRALLVCAPGETPPAEPGLMVLQPAQSRADWRGCNDRDALVTDRRKPAVLGAGRPATGSPRSSSRC